MNYEVDHDRLKHILTAGGDSYSDLVLELTKQLFGLKQPFKTVAPSAENGDKLNEFGFQFLKEAKVLVPEKETA